MPGRSGVAGVGPGGDDERWCGELRPVDVQGVLVGEAGVAVADGELVGVGDGLVLLLAQRVDELLLLGDERGQVDPGGAGRRGGERVGGGGVAVPEAASSRLDGTHPTLRQVPPRTLCSTSSTVLPRSRASMPAAIAAPPVPMTIRS